MKAWILILAWLGSGPIYAQDKEMAEAITPSPNEEAMPAPVTDPGRDPAQDGVPGYHPSEDELKVQPQLPEAQLKRDARSMQNEVYKSLYNRELKPDQREDVLDE